MFLRLAEDTDILGVDKKQIDVWFPLLVGSSNIPEAVAEHISLDDSFCSVQHGCFINLR